MNIGLTAEGAATLSEDELRKLSKGSLANVLLWVSYTTVLWSLKGCMLFLYRRLTYVNVPFPYLLLQIYLQWLRYIVNKSDFFSGFCFYRIGLWQRKLVMIASYLVIVTYIACIATILFHCGTPVEQQWALRPPEGMRFDFDFLRTFIFLAHLMICSHIHNLSL